MVVKLNFLKNKKTKKKQCNDINNKKPAVNKLTALCSNVSNISFKHSTLNVFDHFTYFLFNIYIKYKNMYNGQNNVFKF